MNQNTKQKRSAASWLAELAKGRYGEYALSVLTALLGVACSLIPYFIIIRLITALVNGTAELPRCLTLCAWMAGCWVLRYVLHSVSTSLSHHATFHVLANTRVRLLDKLATLPLGTVLDRSSGSYKNIIVERVDSIETTLAHLLPEMTTNIVGALAVLVLLFIEDWRMGLSMFIVLPLGILCFMSMFSGYHEKFQRTVTATKTLNDTAVEYISGIEVIKVFGQSRTSYAKFVSAAKEGADCFIDWMRGSLFGQVAGMAILPSTLLGILPVGCILHMHCTLSADTFLTVIVLSFGVMQPLMNVIGNLSYVAVCVLGSILAIQGIIDIGVIVSFILYVRLFTSPLTQIAQGMTNLQTASASAHRIFDFLGSEELPDESEKPELPRPVRGEVDFEHIRFSYPDSPDKIIIKDFSAHVAPGQKVAIVGPTGAGKTTMVNLLMRFYEISDGCIRIDGVPSSELSREDVHKLFGMVLQDTWLFEGTVRENLVYNLSDVTDEQLNRVCRACGLDKFVRSLPDGFDTVLSESTSISAGQKQLLTIARAILADNRILILDEATSSVDTRTEQRIQTAMDNLMRGRTSFVIAHRLSTIKDADLILVMRDGDIVEQGTHDQLLEAGGFYADLYNSQFEDVVD